MGEGRAERPASSVLVDSIRRIVCVKLGLDAAQPATVKEVQRLPFEVAPSRIARCVQHADWPDLRSIQRGSDMNVSVI